jgi:hypothetical protein
MKAFLLHADRDFDVDAELPVNSADLMQDLELAVILDTAAGGDALIWDVLQRALLIGLGDPETVLYRQEMFEDCLRSPALIRELYSLAHEAIASEKTVFRMLGHGSPTSILTRSVSVMKLQSQFLQRLRGIADEHAAGLESPGFVRFFAMVAQELDDAYLARLRDRLKELEFPRGQLIGTHLGSVRRAVRWVARRQPHRGWLARIPIAPRSGYGFTIPPRDEAGANALRDLEDRGANEIANALAQSCDHVLSFFAMMRRELAFYVGALNLRDRLAAVSAPTCRPRIAPEGRFGLTAGGLYDVALALTLGRAPVPNDVAGEDVRLIMITGANQGGKSTLLRAVGQAQLMTQAGLFAGADELRIDLSTSVYTHHKREEDASMRSGKLDEELARMSAIADAIGPGGLLLCNESFASTNEREGSEIARQIIRAMLDAGVKVVFVTHQYDLAQSFWSTAREHALFLRAGREDAGERTYTLSPGRPLTTSYGADSYREVFGREPSLTPNAPEARPRDAQTS